MTTDIGPGSAVATLLSKKGARNWDLISERPWGNVYRVDYAESPSQVLKWVRNKNSNTGRLPALLSRRFEKLCPNLLTGQPAKGLFLYEDLELDRFEPQMEPTSAAILAAYAKIQASCVEDPEVAELLPNYSAHNMLDSVVSLVGDTTGGVPGNVFAMMDAPMRHTAEAILLRHEHVLREIADAQQGYPKTLNHTDLNAGNAHQRASGQICLIDWDDAIYAAPGWSLHMVYSGVTNLAKAVSALDDPGETSLNVQALRIYTNALIRTGKYDLASLKSCLPQSACLGILKYIADMAPYEIEDEKDRETIAQFALRRLRDLDLYLGSYYAQNGNSVSTNRTLPVQGKLTNSEVTFPEWNAAGRDSDREVMKGVTAYHENGALLVRNCVPAELLDAVRREMDEKWDAYAKDISGGGALRVGPKRYMVSLGTDGVLGKPEVLAAPGLLALFDHLLGDDYILGSLTAVVSLPGSDAQQWHRDNTALFPEDPGFQTPTFSIAAILPLVATNAQVGATEIALGSHLDRDRDEDADSFRTPQPALGDCYLMDCRVLHRGLPNMSQIKRPILSLVYQRPWYRDYQNFNKQVALQVSPKTLSRFDKDRRSLIAWAQK